MAEKEQRIIEALNEAISEELAAIVQYMWHHVSARGLESPAIVDVFRSLSMDEMKHAEKLAERIDYLGAEPTIKVAAIKTGGDLNKMLRDNLAAEERAIAMYKRHIKLATEMDDPGTRYILEGILIDEEGHARDLTSILEK